MTRRELKRTPEYRATLAQVERTLREYGASDPDGMTDIYECICDEISVYGYDGAGVDYAIAARYVMEYGDTLGFFSIENDINGMCNAIEERYGECAY